MIGFGFTQISFSVMRSLHLDGCMKPEHVEPVILKITKNIEATS